MPNDAITEGPAAVVADGRLGAGHIVQDEDFLVNVAEHSADAMLISAEAFADHIDDGALPGVAPAAAAPNAEVPIADVFRADTRDAVIDLHDALSAGVGAAIEAMPDHSVSSAAAEHGATSGAPTHIHDEDGFE